MLNQIMALTWKELKVFFKDTGAVVFIFLQPFVFIVIMSYAMTGMFGGGDRPVPLLVVNQDRGTQAAGVIARLNNGKGVAVETAWEGQPLTRALAEKLVTEGRRGIALVFPPEFSQVLEQAPGRTSPQTASVAVIADPATPAQVIEPIMGMLQGLVQEATLTAAMPKGIDYMFQEIAPQAPEQQREQWKSQAEQVLSGGTAGGASLVMFDRSAPVGMHAQKYPNAFQQNVPGYTIYGIFWIVTLLASSVLQEKRDGTFRRLLASPMSRAVMLAGKLLPFFIINLLQIAVMLGASHFLFGLDLGSSPAGLVAVSVAASATATGLGVLVSALARTEAQIGGLTTLLLLTLSALGGTFVPRFVMPEWLKTLGALTPHAWALDAYLDLFVRGYGFTDILPQVGVLAAFALVFFAVGVWRFRFE